MDHLADIADYISLLMSSEHFHLLLVVGPPGWGKSSLCRRVLNDLGVGHHELGTYATPLGLYNGLAEHPDELVLVDDCAGLFHNPMAMAVLNAATWPNADGGPRVVRWTSNTDLAVASSVTFLGKMIVLTNVLPETPQAAAFKNRALLYRLEVNRESIGDHLVKAARTTGRFGDPILAEKVAEFLGAQAEFHSPEHISLRTLRLGYELATVNQDRWQQLLLKALPQADVDPKQLVLTLGQSKLKVEEQAGAFIQKTGLSRRRFFYFREQLGIYESAKRKSAKVAAASKTKPKSKIGKR